MSDVLDGQTNWYGDVLTDLAKACRRDGLHKTAEVIEDAAIVMAQEGHDLNLKKASAARGGLKLVASRK